MHSAEWRNCQGTIDIENLEIIYELHCFDSHLLDTCLEAYILSAEISIDFLCFSFEITLSLYIVAFILEKR